MSTPKSKLISYGGQAVIEGVMMRGSRSVAVAVRNPQQQIVIHTEPLNPAVYGGRWLRVPFVRGLIMLWDALGLGVRALLFSADIAVMEEDGTTADGEFKPSQAFSAPVQIGALLLSLAMSIGLFFVLPAFLGGLVERWWDGPQARNVSHIVEGGVRLGLLVGYVWIIGRLPDIQRLFGYHGAEHKTINAYEAGADLTPESVARFPLEHPRCGTAFLLTVVIFSVILFTLLPEFSALQNAIGPILTRILTRIILIPVVASLAYEYIRLTALFQNFILVRWLTKPNLALQRLTTREPDTDMLTVAIAAFEQMLATEQGQTAAVSRTFVTAPAMSD